MDGGALSDEPTPIPEPQAASPPPTPEHGSVDPDTSPFAPPPAPATIPFDRDSEEAEAIRIVLAEAAEARRTGKPPPGYYVW